MDSITLAYLAGAMDSDGFFGIKRSTYHMRVRGDASQPTFSERCGLKQTADVVPKLLKETFGGNIAIQNASTEHGKLLYGWDATDKVAANAARLLLPYLKIKKRQAEFLLELRHTKDEARYSQISYWFEQEYPDWQKLPLITFAKTAEILRYADSRTVTQAVMNKSLLALKYDNSGKEQPRVPLLLVEIFANEIAKGKGSRPPRPKQLMEWRERLWNECRELNRIGTGQHPITERTGIYAGK